MIAALMACVTLFIMLLWPALWVLVFKWLYKRWRGKKDVLVILLAPAIMASTALFFALASVVALRFIE